MIKMLAKSKGVSDAELIRSWVVERIHAARATVGARHAVSLPARFIYFSRIIKSPQPNSAATTLRLRFTPFLKTPTTVFLPMVVSFSSRCKSSMFATG